MTIPETMNGVVLTGHGGLDKLEWREDLPVPVPQAGEVLIRVGAAALNNTDVNTRTGWYSKAVRGDTASGAADGYGDLVGKDGGWSGAALSFPRIQGADCCGEILAVGAGVPAARVGERVLVRAVQVVADADTGVGASTFGSERDGAFAEYTCVAAEDAVAVQSDLSDVELASFPCAFSTAEGMIQRVGLGAERVLVTGASGGVGSAAIQLSRRRGAHVTAVSSLQKADALRELGADEVLAREAEPPAQAFDVVLDLVGGASWPGLIEALRPGGRYVTAGAIAGPIVELDLRTLYLRDLAFFGCTHQPASVFTDLVRYIEAGEIRPVVARTYPLRDLRIAQEAFLSKAHVGKICLSVRE
ncbi:alcohol dehydrogenase family protein [Stappia sp. MMSF_3263]|uniref:alcohol dehydrogenase family protein n=1 Tax=Stappia sp. MMSF_3263 TaxID=3046693 RepID=UPI00273D6201|nr:alcohol dehydrogenase family protein [Stappia sp. MMSF_3263]